jgi:hypothetical protein
MYFLVKVTKVGNVSQKIYKKTIHLYTEIFVPNNHPLP